MSRQGLSNPSSLPSVPPSGVPVAVPCGPGDGHSLLAASAAPLTAHAVANHQTYFEILPGLRIELGGHHSVDVSPVEGCDGRMVRLTVRAETFSLGPPDMFLTGTGLGLRAVLKTSASSDGLRDGRLWDKDASLSGADLTVGTASLGPLMGAEDVEEFLSMFGPSGAPRSQPSEGGVDFRPLDDADVSVPCAKVGSFVCKLPGRGGGTASVSFPECVGSGRCTLRALLGYYVRTLLGKMEEDAAATKGDREGRKDDAVSLKAATADVTSVYGSAAGMAAGSLLFGPVGFVAGSYYGGKAGRAHSSALVGAAAGAVLLGPAGLVVGAIAGSRRDVKESERKARSEVVAPKTVGEPEEEAANCGSVVDGATQAAGRYVSDNKNELAGTTGVIAGAAAGAAVLGPLGVIPGALAGSISGRKIVQDCTKENESSTTREARGEVVHRSFNGENKDTESSNRPYRFGDMTRGIISRGKENRGASKDEGYKFGDFTRGLFSSK